MEDNKDENKEENKETDRQTKRKKERKNRSYACFSQWHKRENNCEIIFPSVQGTIVYTKKIDFQ